MRQSYCQLKGLMSECTIHFHRRFDPKIRFSMCRFYEPRSHADNRCLHLRENMNYHCDCLEAQKAARMEIETSAKNI
jgi:hypothetical protein